MDASAHFPTAATTADRDHILCFSAQSKRFQPCCPPLYSHTPPHHHHHRDAPEDGVLHMTLQKLEAVRR